MKRQDRRFPENRSDEDGKEALKMGLLCMENLEHGSVSNDAGDGFQAEFEALKPLPSEGDPHVARRLHH